MHIVDEESFQSTIKSLRDTSSQTEWVLLGHADGNPETVKVFGSGSGNYDSFSSSLDESNVMYALVRVSQKIDLSTTTKFVYIYYIGDKVGALQRGKFASSHSAVKAALSPYHVDFEITNPNEISNESILARVAETTGVVNKTKEKQHSAESNSSSSKRTSSFGFQGSSAAQAKSSNVTLDAKLQEAISDVRNDKTETNWALASYQGNDVKKPIELVATGNGGVDELSSNLSPSMIAYGLVRVVDVIEGIKTVKFVFIVFIGTEVAITKRATVSTHKGTVVSGFGSIHVTLEISGSHEISDEIILSKVQEASGSKSKVK